MSDTPETEEAVERWRQGKINIFDEMARMETERNRYKSDVALITKERDSLQDQRDFCMGEIKRLREDYLLELQEALRATRERDEARAERDEWIARFRADEELINEAMLK